MRASHRQHCQVRVHCDHGTTRASTFRGYRHSWYLMWPHIISDMAILRPCPFFASSGDDPTSRQMRSHTYLVTYRPGGTELQSVSTKASGQGDWPSGRGRPQFANLFPIPLKTFYPPVFDPQEQSNLGKAKCYWHNISFQPLATMHPPVFPPLDRCWCGRPHLTRPTDRFGSLNDC